MESLDLVAYSYYQGKQVLEKKSPEHLKKYGQFLTPPTVARYMAKQLEGFKSGDTLLEPACGSAVLISAVIERLIFENNPLDISIVAYEIDNDLYEVSQEVLTVLSKEASKLGINIEWQLFQEDFILTSLPDKQPTLFNIIERKRKAFTHIISNPPYFKLNMGDKRVKAVSGKLNGQTNIYTLFMALSAKLLFPQGKACFIVPRSFCSGVYFSEFRRDLIKEVTPTSVHVFQSRNDVFGDVLQENVVFSFVKLPRPKEQRYWTGSIRVSSSTDDRSLEDGLISRRVSFQHFLSDKNDLLLFRIPTGILDEQILDLVDKWEGSLEKYGFQVSTGRVVPFRAKKLLKDRLINDSEVVPLLWMQNVKPYQIEYPLDKFDKPQAISTHDPSLLVPNSNYVLLRRFSAKEDRRRIISAPFIRKNFKFDFIAFENHLNVIYKKRGLFTTAETLGLSAFLNSAIVDRYFRIVNGNTQVNAAELRILPLPPMEVINNIGERIRKAEPHTEESTDTIIYSILRESNLLTDDFPMIQEDKNYNGKNRTGSRNFRYARFTRCATK